MFTPSFRQTDRVTRVRLAEVSAANSLFTDIATGQPQEDALRTCVVAMRLADYLALDHEDRVVGYYAGLLRFLGCTADAAETAVLGGGDDLTVNAAFAPTVMQPGREELGVAIRVVGAGEPVRTRLGLLARALTEPGGRERSLGGHCEVAARFGARMGLPAGVAAALAAAYARWDGRGVPAHLARAAIPVGMRLAIVARDAELIARTAWPRTAERILRRRRAGAYDPAVVDAALAIGIAALLPDDQGVWEHALAADPAPELAVDEGGLDDVLLACADFADLKFPHVVGHSRAVAELAADAAAGLGLPPRMVTEVRRAGLVHDLGRVGVPAGIWMRRGPLGTADWEAARLHPYYTERILTRCGPLAGLARLASAHHERLDGTGYPKGLPDLDRPALLLAAADAYPAMTQDRPHRPALTADAAAAALRREATNGRIGRAEVEAVLGVWPGTARREAARPIRPGSPSARSTCCP